MTIALIPDSEKIVGAFLRAHADIVALDTRIVGEPPSDTDDSWVQIVELDAPSDPRSTVDHLVASYLQISIYASKAGEDGSQQKELSTLRRTVRRALNEIADTTQGGAVISRVRVNGDSRIPDVTFEPVRQRRIITATVHLHAATT